MTATLTDYQRADVLIPPPTPPDTGLLIGLVGVARSGKDSVGQILCTERGFTRRAFADALKAAALATDPLIRTRSGAAVLLSEHVAHVGWERAKERTEVRRFLQNLGVAMRQVDPEIWVRPVFTNRPRLTVITDVRFPNEAEAVTRAGGELWRIVRPGTHPALGHISDTALTDYPTTRTILNDGTLDDLRAQVLNSTPTNQETP